MPVPPVPVPVQQRTISAGVGYPFTAAAAAGVRSAAPPLADTAAGCSAIAGEPLTIISALLAAITHAQDPQVRVCPASHWALSAPPLAGGLPPTSACCCEASEPPHAGKSESHDAKGVAVDEW